jgi:hypothetical protein
MNYEHIRAGRRLVFFCCIAASLVALAATPAFSASSATPKKIPARFLIKVKARIRVNLSPGLPGVAIDTAAREVTFSPALINVGTVIILVSNSDKDPHQLEIAGVTSRRMGGGGKAVMRVTFKTPGIYSVALTTQTPVPVTGALKVVK